MYGIKALLTLGLLLTAADARPEGYGGVKGGRNHKSTANAFASAHATAQADVGYPGTPQSSAGASAQSFASASAQSFASASAQSFASASAQSSASATANAFAGGDTSNAAANANAYADGGNIGEVIGSDDANGNANPLGDSDNLRLSSVHAKDSENRSDNEEDGTYVGGHRNADTGSHGNSGSVGVTGESQDRRPGCGVTAGVKGHRSASGCTDRNVGEDNSPTYNGNPDLSGGSKYPTSLDGGSGGNNAGAQPCTSGASGCPKNKPSVSNPYPTYNGNPDLSGGSKYPTSLDGGSGGNNAGAQPCTSGASGCPKNKPSVSNPYPTYNGNPDSSGGSKYPTSLDGGSGGNNAGVQPCTSGASGCPKNKPSVSNPYPTYNGNADLSGGSKYPTSLDGGSGGNNAGAQPCTSGASGCPKNKPSVSNPYPTYNGNPDSSGGSKYPTSLDGGSRGNNAGAQPCTSGASGCPKNKPSVSNPYPTYNGNPDSSGGSKYPMSLDGGSGGNNAGAQPCTSGASGCPKNKPSVSNPYPTYNGNPDSSGGSKYPTSLDGGSGGNNAGAQPCTSGASGCPKNKPSVSNPYPTYNGNPDSSGGSKYPTSLDGDSGGNNAGAQPCTSGASGCPKNKPSVSNPYPTYNGKPDLSGGSKYPTSLDGGSGGNNAGAQPCTSGASGCPKNKPSVSNPYPTYNGNPDLSGGSKYPTSLDGGSGGDIAKSEPPSCSGGAPGCSGNKPSVANPHAGYPGYADSSPDSQHAVGVNHGPVNHGHAGKPKDTPCFPGDPRCLAGSKPKPTTPDPSTTGTIESGPIPCTPGSVNCPNTKPGVANPYQTHQENPDMSGGSKYPTNLNGDYGDKSPTTGEHPTSGSSQYPGYSRKPDTSNPFLNGEIDVSHIKDSVNAGVDSGIKTNPANPFLNPHSQVGPTTCTKHPEKPNGNYGGSPTDYPHGGSPGDSTLPTIKPNPSNPFLPHNGNLDAPNHAQNTNLPNAQGHPTTNGGCRGSTACGSNESGHPTDSSEYPVNKPNPSNPFLPNNGNVDSTYDLNHFGPGNGNPQNTNLPTAQGHPTTNGGCRGSTGCESNESGHPTDSSEYPVNKPNPSNPFLPNNGNLDSANHAQNTNLPSGQGHPTTNSGCHGSTGCGSNEPGHPTGSSEYPANKPNPSNPFLPNNGNLDSANHAQNTNLPSGQGHPTTNGGCHGSTGCGSNEPGHPTDSSEYPVNKPNPSNPFLPNNGNLDSANHAQNTNLPSGQGHPTTNGGCRGSTGCGSNKPGNPTGSSEYPVNKPNPTNPFLPNNGNVDSTYGLNHPGPGNGNPQNTNLPTSQGHPTTNGGCRGSTGCGSNEPGHPTGSSEYPANKPNPSNPFLPPNGEVTMKTTGTRYPDLKPPVLKNPGSFGESSYDRIDPHSNVNKNHGSQDLPSVYPGKEPTGSNPYLDDGQLTNQQPKPGSHETLNSPKPFPVHNVEESHSTWQYHGNGSPYGTEDQGVKTHRPGVKGGSRRSEPPAKLQESELMSGDTGSAYSTAHASSSASAHSSAYASSSSYSGGGHSSAKSDAHSDLGSSGSSNSWASSSASASASASAFASSSSHQSSENWQFPDVPAE